MAAAGADVEKADESGRGKGAFWRHLCCPKCRGNLTHDPSQGDEGVLTCACGASFPVVRSIPRFVDTDQYVGNFSFEWTTHRKTQLDTDDKRISEKRFAEQTGLSPEDLDGKLVLDVGCGMGRYADIAVKWGATVIGVDLSLAVESAQANLGGTGMFQAVQASVFDLPFRDDTFDVIYSLGVLHHTPDCRKAFMCLPRLLKKNGALAVFLYSLHTYPPNGIDEVRDRLYRRFTTKMNHRLLHAIFRVLCRVRMRWKPFWHMLLPGFVFHAIPRLHSYTDYQWRVLDSFDWYSPEYQSKHSYPEVVRWYREAGFRDILPLDYEVCVLGRK